MKFYIIIFFVFSTMLACSSLPPEKKFTTETYILPPGTCIYKCTQWSEDNNICGDGLKPCCVDAISLCPNEIDYPPNPIVIDMGNPAGSSIGGLINEIDYQEFLKKSCAKWR